MQSSSPRLRSQQIFLKQDMWRNVLPNRDSYEDALLESMRMGSNMAAGNQQKHLSLSFTT